MKPLEDLANTEKARLLHELFPQEIPALLTFTYNMCLTQLEDEQAVRSQWQNGLLTVDAWLSFIRAARDRIDKYDKRLQMQSELFAGQLFEGFIALYMLHCLDLYTTVRKHPNPKFVLAVDLLFNP